MIDIARLETFLQAADNLSFSEAARKLHLTQPTVSHHIKALERELDVELFIRSSSGLRLTEAGRLLLPWARKVIFDSLELKSIMDALQQGISGNLRIAFGLGHYGRKLLHLSLLWRRKSPSRSEAPASY